MKKFIIILILITGSVNAATLPTPGVTPDWGTVLNEWLLVSHSSNGELDPNLMAIAALVTAANKVTYWTDAGTADLFDLSAYMRGLLDDANEATLKASINLEPGTDVQAYDADLAALAGLTTAANKAIYWTGAGTADLYDLSVYMRGLLDDANEATLKESTNLEIGTDVQAYDSDLDALAANDYTADVNLADVRALGPVLDIRVYDADFDGAISNAEFDTALTAAANKILLISAPVTISADTEMDNSIGLRFTEDGIFNIATDCELYNLDMGKIQADNRQQIFDCTGTGKVQVVRGGFVSICWWGAIANDGEDDTAAIRAAYTVLAEDTRSYNHPRYGGGIIYMPIGRYRIESEIVLDSSHGNYIEFRGEGACTEGYYNGTVLDITGLSAGEAAFEYDAGVYIYNHWFRNFSITGIAAGGSGQADGNAFNLHQIAHFHFEDMMIDYCKIAFNLDGSEIISNKWDNVRFCGNGHCILQQNGHMNDNTFTNCAFETSTDPNYAVEFLDGASTYNLHTLKFENCLFQSNQYGSLGIEDGRNVHTIILSGIHSEANNTSGGDYDYMMYGSFSAKGSSFVSTSNHIKAVFLLGDDTFSIDSSFFGSEGVNRGIDMWRSNGTISNSRIYDDATNIAISEAFGGTGVDIQRFTIEDCMVVGDINIPSREYIEEGPTGIDVHIAKRMYYYTTGGAPYTKTFRYTKFRQNPAIYKSDPSVVFDVTTAGDTDWWFGVQDDAGGDDDDTYQIGTGTTPGTNTEWTWSKAGLTGATGNHITLGSTQWDDGSDKIDGEQIADDTIDDDSIDWTDVNADDIGDGSTNAIPTLTQEVSWDTAYGWGDHSSAGYQDYDAQLDDIAALAVTDGNFIVGDGSNWVAESGATARTSLGLGNVENTATTTVLSIQGVHNLIKNGDMEVWSDGVDNYPDGWDTSNGAEVERVEGIIGNYACKIFCKNAYAQGIKITQGANNYLKIKPSTKYTFSCWVKSDTGEDIGLLVYCYQDAVYKSGPINDVRFTNTDWEYYCHSFTTPADANNIMVIFNVYTNPSSAYVDGIQIVEGEALASGNNASDALSYGLTPIYVTKYGVGFNETNPQEDVHAADTIRADVAFNLNGTDGVSGTLEMDDGTTEKVTLVFTGGILTSRTVASTTGSALIDWTD